MSARPACVSARLVDGDHYDGVRLTGSAVILILPPSVSLTWLHDSRSRTNRFGIGAGIGF